MTKQLTKRKMEMELHVLLLFSRLHSKEKHLDLLIKCTSNIKKLLPLLHPLPIILSKLEKGKMMFPISVLACEMRFIFVLFKAEEGSKSRPQRVCCVSALQKEKSEF